jgi:hypothetical protein
LGIGDTEGLTMVVCPFITVEYGVCRPAAGLPWGPLVPGCGVAEGAETAGVPGICERDGGGDPAGWLAGELGEAVGGEAVGGVLAVFAGVGAIDGEAGVELCTGGDDVGADGVAEGALFETGAEGDAEDGVFAGADAGEVWVAECGVLTGADCREGDAEVGLFAGADGREGDAEGGLFAGADGAEGGAAEGGVCAGTDAAGGGDCTGAGADV